MFELDENAWDMAERAEEDVDVVTVEELPAELEDEETVVVDIRDVRELWIDGAIPDTEHAPRGMLEFWADPETEYYRDVFHPDRRYVFYCRGGGRSAMAAKRLKEMGYEDVGHLAGGFQAWEEEGGEIAEVPQKDYKDR